MTSVKRAEAITTVQWASRALWLSALQVTVDKPRRVPVDSPILLCDRLQNKQKLDVLAAESYDLRAVPTRALPSLTLCGLGSRKGGSARVVRCSVGEPPNTQDL
jgi:hypothetical protein